MKIHPFANGNGQRARMIADLRLMRYFKRERLAWGGGSLGNTDPNRPNYIAALQDADRNHYAPLVALASAVFTV